MIDEYNPEIHRLPGKKAHWDRKTNSWLELIGDCPYCSAILHNDMAKTRYNYVIVRRLYNTRDGNKEILIKICKRCASTMHDLKELIEIIPIEKGQIYHYEFATNSDLTAEERKSGLRAC